MNQYTHRKTEKGRRAEIGYFRLTSFLLIGMTFFALAGTATSTFTVPHFNTAAAAASQNPKKYKATREITVDKQTGKLRMPTADEVEDLVNMLSRMSKKSSEEPNEINLPNGANAVRVPRTSAPLTLARPGADGTWEVRCVTSFEEGAEFLGIVEDASQQ